MITHARTEAARFLGYEVVTLDAMTKQDHRGQRCINGAVRLKIPVEVIQTSMPEIYAEWEALPSARTLVQ